MADGFLAGSAAERDAGTAEAADGAAEWDAETAEAAGGAGEELPQPMLEKCGDSQRLDGDAKNRLQVPRWR